VGERRDHAGRLADDAGERRDAGVAHVGDQPARAEAADLLVVAEREVDGERQVGGRNAGTCATARPMKLFMSALPRP
jgi:hypothetical protein